jgi:hypothetical protein
MTNQSGRPTAVGMALESAWRTVPFVAGANLQSIGVTGTNPLRFWILNPSKGFPVKPQIEVGEDEIDGDFEIHRTILTGKDYNGDFIWKADPENLYYALLGMFGLDLQTEAQAADTTHSPAVYRHDFRPNGRRGYQPSFTIEEIFGDGTYGRLTSGCIVQKLVFTFGKVVQVQMSVYGYRQIPNNYPDANGVRTDYDFGSAPTVLPGQMGGDGSVTIQRTANPTYVDVAETLDGNGPLAFAGMTYGSAAGFANTFLQVDGAPVALDILEGTTITIERNIQKFQTGGSDFDMGATVGNAWKISGKLDVLYRNNILPLSVLKKAAVGLNFRIHGVSIGTSGQKYGLEVFLPKVNFLEGGVEIPATAMMTGGNFIARKDPFLGYSAQLSLWNTVDNSLLGGTAATNPGGLGGWNNS